MSSPASLTTLENTLQHAYRDALNHAESMEDARHAFARTVRELLAAVAGDVRIFDEDIHLTPDTPPGYQLTGELMESASLKTALGGGELPAILARFAASAAHRLQQLEEHPDRIRARIHLNH